MTTDLVEIAHAEHRAVQAAVTALGVFPDENLIVSEMSRSNEYGIYARRKAPQTVPLSERELVEAVLTVTHELRGYELNRPRLVEGATVIDYLVLGYPAQVTISHTRTLDPSTDIGRVIFKGDELNVVSKHAHYNPVIERLADTLRASGQYRNVRFDERED